jgi:hypothetical protein
MGVLSSVMFVVYIVLMPALTFVWLWRDAWVRAAVAAASAPAASTSVTTAQARGAKSSSSKAAKDVKPGGVNDASAMFAMQNPLVQQRQAQNVTRPALADSEHTRGVDAATLSFHDSVIIAVPADVLLVDQRDDESTSCRASTVRAVNACADTTPAAGNIDSSFAVRNPLGDPRKNQHRMRQVFSSGGGDASAAITTGTAATDIPPPQLAATPVSTAPGVSLDPVLGLFFYDYKPRFYYMRHLELALLFLLCIFRALLSRPTTLALINVKVVVICLALFGSLVHVLWARPFLDADAWMGWVRAMLLVCSIGCSLLNAATSSLDAGIGGETLRMALSAGTFVVLALCAVTVLVLLVGVGYHMYIDAGIEQAQMDEAADARESRTRAARGVLRSASNPLQQYRNHKSSRADRQGSRRERRLGTSDKKRAKSVPWTAPPRRGPPSAYLLPDIAAAAADTGAGLSAALPPYKPVGIVRRRFSQSPHGVASSISPAAIMRPGLAAGAQRPSLVPASSFAPKTMRPLAPHQRTAMPPLSTVAPPLDGACFSAVNPICSAGTNVPSSVPSVANRVAAVSRATSIETCAAASAAPIPVDDSTFSARNPIARTEAPLSTLAGAAPRVVPPAFPLMRPLGSPPVVSRRALDLGGDSITVFAASPIGRRGLVVHAPGDVVDTGSGDQSVDGDGSDGRGVPRNPSKALLLSRAMSLRPGSAGFGAGFVSGTSSRTPRVVATFPQAFGSTDATV